jgi:phage recombination protein Bet
MATQTNGALTTTALQSHSLIRTMADRYGVDPAKLKQTLTKTIFPQDREASDEQVIMFMVVANHYELNPFTKEIYAFPTKGGGIVPIVSIDGWLALINRQPTLDGIDFSDTLTKDGKLESITCRIFRKDRSHPMEITEYFAECFRETRNRDGKVLEDAPWAKWPRRMLRHKALIQCARVAFSLSGIYDPDEGERIIEGEVSRHEAAVAVVASELPADIRRASDPSPEPAPRQQYDTAKDLEEVRTKNSQFTRFKELHEAIYMLDPEVASAYVMGGSQAEVTKMLGEMQSVATNLQAAKDAESKKPAARKQEIEVKGVPKGELFEQ